MIHLRHHTSTVTSRTLRTLQAAAVVCVFALVGTACSNTAFESQPVEEDSTTSSTGADHESASDTGTDAAAGDELALVVESPYEEPDLQVADAEAEISESEAVVPEAEPAAVDPEDAAAVTQVSVGAGESAVCATVQIGRDALLDGADELLATQQDLLVSRADLVEDGELTTLLGAIEDPTSIDAAVFDAALSRCEALGFQP